VIATALATSAPSPAPPFDGLRASAWVTQQVALGPRITGSAASVQLGNRVLTELAANGWLTETQVFTYQNTPARNLVGRWGNGKDVVILGAHYDTRRRADQDKQQPDQPVPGANDGASGAAVLLELARVLPHSLNSDTQQVWLAFFDAEDNGGLDGWGWIAGSRYFAAQLNITPTAMVNVDMVGDAQQNIYLERNSNQQLAGEIWDVAACLGYSAQFIRQPKWAMEDDHTPFLDRGWRAVDIIDFDYPYWHTTADTPDKISPQSLERVGRTLQAWLQAATPCGPR
jgi:Zn-dependent M28 family amino/carboxypeptidase